MKKFLLIMLLFAGLTGFKQANVRHITGSVSAKDDGMPLPGVSVTIKGTGTGTLTDTNGKFAIDVPDGSTVLLFTYIGFEKKEVRLGKSNKLHIVLEANPRSLNEVVVVGYGVQKKRDITASEATISSDAVIAAPSQYNSALQGKVAGVQIMQKGKASSNVIIRGL